MIRSTTFTCLRSHHGGTLHSTRNVSPLASLMTHFKAGGESRTKSSTLSHSFHQHPLILPPIRDDEDRSVNNTNIFLSHPIASLYTTGKNSTHRQSRATIRHYHTTNPSERGAAIVLTLGAVAATAKAGQYIVQGYNEWKEASEAAAEVEKLRNTAPNDDDGHIEDDSTSKPKGTNNFGEAAEDSFSHSKKSDGGSTGKAKEEPRENFFAKFFNLSVGSKYYEGGFEDQMTRKEAALILGVRESSTAKRIKEAHRKLLVLNHPDTGGSTYVAGKINEAKELLLKGKRM